MKTFSFAVLFMALSFAGRSQSSTRPKEGQAETLRNSFHEFMEAENHKDTAAVKKILWDSPDMVFAPFGKRDSSTYFGYWGVPNTMAHFNKLYSLGIHLEPDYQNERIAFLGDNVGEIFVPAKISFPDRAPLPFLVISYWVNVKGKWRLATDIAIPSAN